MTDVPDEDLCRAELGERVCRLTVHWPEGEHVDDEGKPFTDAEVAAQWNTG